MEVRDRAHHPLLFLDRSSETELSYTERLKKLKLPTLAYRLLRGDMIEVYKILTDKYDPAAGKILKLHKDYAQRPSCRGNSKKLYVQRSRLDIRKYSFGVRTANVWNSLPEQVITAPTLNTFKNRLDKFWDNQEIKYDYKASLYTGTGNVTIIEDTIEESNIEDLDEPALENNYK